MSFGFSVGDFVAAANLIKCIVSSLQSSSTSEYREITLELDGLQRALHEIERLQCSPMQQPAVNAIKVAALMCQHPLEDFAGKMKKYESLGIDRGGKLGKRDLLKMWGKKLSWGFVMEEELLRLRAYLVVHVGSLNMRLMTQGLVTASISAEQAGEAHSVLVEDIQRSHTALLATKNDVMGNGLVTRSNNALLRRLAELVTGGVLPELKTLVDLATKVWNSNLQIIGLMVKLQCTSPVPDLRHTWLQEPIRFEDALGRVFPVPSEYNWDKLGAIIFEQFSGGPGHGKAFVGEYELYNTQDSSQIISRSQYPELTPGMSITMAMIIGPYDQGPSQRCPKVGCMSKGGNAVKAGDQSCRFAMTELQKTLQRRFESFVGQVYSPSLNFGANCRAWFDLSREAKHRPVQEPVLKCFIAERSPIHWRGIKHKRVNSHRNAKVLDEEIFILRREESQRLKNFRVHLTLPSSMNRSQRTKKGTRKTRPPRNPGFARPYGPRQVGEGFTPTATLTVPEARFADDGDLPVKPDMKRLLRQFESDFIVIDTLLLTASTHLSNV